MKKIFLISLLALGFVSCEDKNDDKIYSAQQCLNSATRDNVDACVAKVAGMSSNQSYVIRCSADFIKQNITTIRIVNATEDLKKNSGDVTVKALSFFTFQDVNSVTGKDLAVAAVDNCTRTGSQILRDLALLGQMATIISSLAALIPGDDGIDPDALKSWLAGLNQTTIDNLPVQDLEALGSAIIQAQPSYCGKNGQFEGTEVCTDLNQAIAGGNPAQIAKDLIDQIKN